MTARDEITRRIDEAFASAARPLTAQDLAPPSIEAPYAIEHFLGRSRADITRGSFLPSLHMEDFTYMTAQAVEYYLPAVLKLLLLSPFDDELWIYLSGFLGSAHRDDEQTLRNLGPAQHAAIAALLELLCRDMDGAFEPERKRAAKLARLYHQLATTAR